MDDDLLFSEAKQGQMIALPRGATISTIGQPYLRVRAEREAEDDAGRVMLTVEIEADEAWADRQEGEPADVLLEIARRHLNEGG